MDYVDRLHCFYQKLSYKIFMHTKFLYFTGQEIFSFNFYCTIAMGIHFSGVINGSEVLAVETHWGRSQW